MAFGEPRATLDIDIILDAKKDDAPAILQAFESPRYHTPPREALERELVRDRDASFQVLDLETGLKGDFYLVGSDPLLRYGIANAREVKLGETSVDIAPPEYVILIKLRYFGVSEQAKHRDDIRSILRVSGDQLDLDLIEDWVRQLRIQELWRRCRDETP